MKLDLVSGLSDQVLVHDARALVAEGRANTAALLVYLAEIEVRRLFARRYPSMHAWCVGELHFSRDAAYRRLRAAEAARRYPQLLVAIADGRLHLTAVVLLAPNLTPGNLEELVAAATHQDREAIEMLLAHRFPKADVPTELRPIGSASATNQPSAQAPARTGESGALSLNAPANLPADSTVMNTSEKVAPAPLASTGVVFVAPPPTPYVQVSPLSPQRYALKATLDDETVDLLRRAQALLGHTLASSDYVEVLKRVLQDWVRAAECRKYGLTEKPRERRSAGNGRYIPAKVKRAVFKRDGGRCTFLFDDKRRCDRRKLLQFDHVTPFAQGGRTTVENLRLRCRRHNQVEADRVFGEGFMERKRDQRAARSVTRESGDTIYDASAQAPCPART